MSETQDNKTSRSIYISDEYWNEAQELCKKFRPKKNFSVYLTEALVEKNDRTRKQFEENMEEPGE